MRRSEIRETLFKLLFRAEFNDVSELNEQFAFYFDIQKEIDELVISDEDKDYIINRENEIIAKLPEIDKLIGEKATGWTVDRMGKVDIAIIRLAVFEILFDADIPVGVSINEAVELAKKYGREESGSFVNGVLAKFA